MEGDVSKAELLNNFEVDLPVMHRMGVRDLSAEIQSSHSSLGFDSVNIGETSIQEIALTNTGNRDIDISNIEIQGASGFTHNGVNTLLPRDKTMNIRVAFSPVQAAGTVAATLTVTSDADIPQTNISLTGTGIGDRVIISGSITYNGTPLCAMVLANGQYMFTCGENLGKYELTVPLNDEGMISVLGFVDGFAPFGEEMTPQQATDYDISILPASDSNPVMEVTVGHGISSVPSLKKISGQVLYNGKPLCAMVLANGSHVFSCGGSGEFELEVPLNTEGKIALLVFVDGFKPYSATLTPP
ncbi:MAG: choice-of-anchor D domain-containing protein [Desulfobacterales bacterium]|nr:choice-of-anchor D domain-containing protein [Desulfobacterales bacterium]